MEKFSIIEERLSKVPKLQARLIDVGQQLL